MNDLGSGCAISSMGDSEAGGSLYWADVQRRARALGVSEAEVAAVDRSLALEEHGDSAECLMPEHVEELVLGRYVRLSGDRIVSTRQAEANTEVALAIQHLAKCASCRILLASMEPAALALQEERFLQAVRADKATAQRNRRHLGIASVAPLAVTVMACVAVFLLAWEQPTIRRVAAAMSAPIAILIAGGLAWMMKLGLGIDRDSRPGKERGSHVRGIGVVWRKLAVGQHVLAFSALGMLAAVVAPAFVSQFLAKQVAFTMYESANSIRTGVQAALNVGEGLNHLDAGAIEKVLSRQLEPTGNGQWVAPSDRIPGGIVGTMEDESVVRVSWNVFGKRVDGLRVVVQQEQNGKQPVVVEAPRTLKLLIEAHAKDIRPQIETSAR